MKTKLDIKHDEWPSWKDVLTDNETFKPYTKFEHGEQILGSIPERVNEHVKGKKGKNAALGIGKP